MGGQRREEGADPFFSAALALWFKGACVILCLCFLYVVSVSIMEAGRSELTPLSPRRGTRRKAVSQAPENNVPVMGMAGSLYLAGGPL